MGALRDATTKHEAMKQRVGGPTEFGIHLLMQFNVKVIKKMLPGYILGIFRHFRVNGVRLHFRCFLLFDLTVRVQPNRSPKLKVPGLSDSFVSVPPTTEGATTIMFPNWRFHFT